MSLKKYFKSQWTKGQVTMEYFILFVVLALLTVIGTPILYETAKQSTQGKYGAISSDGVMQKTFNKTVQKIDGRVVDETWP